MPTTRERLIPYDLTPKINRDLRIGEQMILLWHIVSSDFQPHRVGVTPFAYGRGHLFPVPFLVIGNCWGDSRHMSHYWPTLR